MSGLSSANASSGSPTTSDTIAQLTQHGLYSAPKVKTESLNLTTKTSSASQKARVKASTKVTKNGLEVETPAGGGLTVTPAIKIAPELVDGAAVYRVSDKYSYALTDTTSGVAAGYSVLHKRGAPSQYVYDLRYEGQSVVLILQKDFSVTVKAATGEVVGTIDPAWAKDATGKSLASTYEVSGSSLTQTIDLKGATYPVIADPRVQVDWLFRTIEFQRSWTKTAAESIGAFMGICALATPLAGLVAGAVCGAMAGAANIAARQAINTGKCLGIRSNWAVGPPFPVIVNCYA